MIKHKQCTNVQCVQQRVLIAQVWVELPLMEQWLLSFSLLHVLEDMMTDTIPWDELCDLVAPSACGC
jgi:hypothetical protein